MTCLQEANWSRYFLKTYKIVQVAKTLFLEKFSQTTDVSILSKKCCKWTKSCKENKCFNFKVNKIKTGDHNLFSHKWVFIFLKSQQNFVEKCIKSLYSNIWTSRRLWMAKSVVVLS